MSILWDVWVGDGDAMLLVAEPARSGERGDGKKLREVRMAGEKCEGRELASSSSLLSLEMVLFLELMLLPKFSLLGLRRLLNDLDFGLGTGSSLGGCGSQPAEFTRCGGVGGEPGLKKRGVNGSFSP